jgi:hypothetical protein
MDYVTTYTHYAHNIQRKSMNKNPQKQNFTENLLVAELLGVSCAEY